MKAIELLKECRLNLLNREHHERLLNDDDWQLIRKLDEFIADFRVDVPPVEQSDTVENVNNNRMLAGWGRYNFFWCADKGSHDMRLAFIAGYKRALHDAVSRQLRPLCDYTNRPALDSSQICRCGTCQLFARIILAED